MLSRSGIFELPRTPLAHNDANYAVAMGSNTDRLVWIDCEMTGLDPESDEIVEIACIVTDAELNELDAGISLVVQAGEAAMAGMDDFVVQMHTHSGLLPEIAGGITLSDAPSQVLRYIQGHIPEAGKAPLAGSSVYVDRGFLARHMPDVDAHLHYRLIDESTLKELARRWYPRVYFAAPEKGGNHRALGDIRDSIAELRYYRDAVMVTLPGPDTEQAKQVAALHVVDHSGA